MNTLEAIAARRSSRQLRESRCAWPGEQTELGYPVRVHYAYTHVREEQRALRYDNAPHHPEIVTHPHHKHIGPADRLAPDDQPNLSQVLAEVERWLGQ